MSKALVATGVVAVTGTIAVPAVLLSGSSSLEEGEFQWQGFMPEFNSAKDIKDVYQKNDCLKEKTKSIESWDGTSSSVSSDGLNFEPSTISGCLIVEYYKQTYSDNKWSGKFKFIWSLTGTGENGKGFVTVVYAETRDAKLFVDSSFYMLKEESSKWNVNYSEKGNKEIVNNDDLSKWLPKPGNIIQDYQNNINQYWGFDPDPSKACKGESCGKRIGKPTTVSVSWKISKGDNDDATQQGITSLFSNFNEWFPNSFNSSNEESLLYSQVSSINFDPKLTKQNGES